MSSADFRAYVDPSKAPPMGKKQARMSLSKFPPPLERLLGPWSRLVGEPFRGITTDGRLISGLFEAAPSGAPVEAASRAALAWLDSLPGPYRSQVAFPVDSALWRQWQNTPLILRDPQLELETLDPRQRELALELVRVSLSDQGYERTREVMANNRFIGELLGATALLNEWSFTLSIFGEPSTFAPWGWQLFGHHLALSCFFVGQRMVLSPVFLGVEPDHDEGPLRRRLFEPHETRALALMKSLSDPERARAVLYASMRTADQPPGRFHPDDGRQVGGAFQDNRVVPHEGLPAGALGVEQRRRLLDLVDLFVENLPEGPALARTREIERHLSDTHFAWIGPADDVNPFYFRIHSPVALIEFDHHSGIFLANKEPERFHVHTIVRTPNGGDYGADLLRQHYAAGGHGAGGGRHSHDGGRTFHDHD